LLYFVHTNDKKVVSDNVFRAPLRIKLNGNKRIMGRSVIHENTDDLGLGQ
jgi:hypothetical protein